MSGVEHLLHPVDLGDLIHLDVGSHFEDHVVLSGAIGGEQLVHHGHRALVMLAGEAPRQARKAS